jgi:hypothetical protein
VELEDGLVDLADQHDPDRHDPDGRGLRLPPPRLLGSFDPLLLGWASREFVVGEHRSIVTTNGVFRPFALVDGRAVATWSYARSEVTLMPFGELPEDVLAALDADAADVRRFFGTDRADLGPDREDLGPNREDLGPNRADLGPNRADPGTDGEGFEGGRSG